MILFGTNPIAWSNDDDWSIGDHISLDQCLDDCRKIGFDGIEKGHKMPNDGTELKDKLGDYGLKFVGGWHSTNILDAGSTLETEIAAMNVHLEMTKQAGSDVIIVCECSNTVHGNDQAAANDRPIMDEADWPRFMEAINALADLATEQGVRFCYHHHTGTVVESADDIHRFLELAGPNTKLLLDTGHCTAGGADPAAIADAYMDRVGHIHCKNVRPKFLQMLREENLSFLEGVRRGMFTVPGDEEGSVDFMPVLKAAAKAGYSGWIVIEAEQDPLRRDPFQYQSMGLETLKEMSRKAGLIS